MLNIEKFINDLSKKSDKLKYGQIILGEEKHPRSIDENYEIPDYIKNFNETTDFFEIACLVSGKAVICISNKTYLLNEGDICFIKHDIRHFESYFNKNTSYEIVWMFYSSARRIVVVDIVYSPVSGYKMLSSINFRVKSESIFLLENISRVSDPKKDFKNVLKYFKEWLSYVLTVIKAGNYKKSIISEEKQS